MKTKSALLLCCLFIQASLLFAGPICKGERSTEIEKAPRTATRQSDDRSCGQESSRGAELLRSVKDSTVADDSSVNAEPEWTINASEEFVNQKIAAVQQVQQKWRSQMVQWDLRSSFDSIKEDEKIIAKAAAVADRTCWDNEAQRVTQWLLDDRLDTERRGQLTEFMEAVDQATCQLDAIIAYCDSAHLPAPLHLLSRLSILNTSKTVGGPSPKNTKPSPSNSNHRLTGSLGSSSSSFFSSEKQVDHLVTAIQTATQRSEKLADFKQLDQRFLQILHRWIDRENARLKYEAALKEHERAKEELDLQKNIHDATNIEETLPAQVSRCARICSYVFGCINTPCFDVAAFFTGVAGVADEIGQEIINHPLHRAESLEKKAAAQVAAAKKRFEDKQEEAPEFHQETERLEQEARACEAKNIIKLIQEIIPPAAVDGETLWNQWAEKIIQGANFDVSWIKCLACHGQAHPDWAQSQVKRAFQQRVDDLNQFIKGLKDKESPEQKEKERLGKEALTKRETAAAAKKIVLDHQQKIEQLTAETDSARKALKEANQELDRLEQKPLLENEGSKKGISSMDHFLETFSQQWMKIKQAKENLQEKEMELIKVKSHHQQAEPIAVEKEIDFNTSLQAYQHYGEKLGRHIERAMDRFAANNQAMESILNIRSAPQLIQKIIGVVDLPPDDSLRGPRAGVIARDASVENDVRNEIDQLASLESYDHHENGNGKEPDYFSTTQSFSSGSSPRAERIRRNSLLGGRSAEFCFPGLIRLSDPSYDYLQQLLDQCSEEEEKESEESSCGGVFRNVPSMSVCVPSLPENMGYDIGLPLTPSSVGERQQQSIIEAQREAVGKPPGEAFAHWEETITQAEKLIEIYRQIIQANEEVLQKPALGPSPLVGMVTQSNERSLAEKNRKEAQEQKANWIIKLHSLKVSQACDLAVCELTQPLFGKSLEQHQQDVLTHYQTVIDSYEMLENFCRAMLKEYPSLSPELQAAWMKKLEESIQEGEQWKVKKKFLADKK